MCVLNQWTVLIVEEQSGITTLAEQIYCSLGNRCNVEKVYDYDAAALLLVQNFYDLVLLDMAGTRDFELLKIAVESKFKTIIFTENCFDIADMSRAYHMGAAAYLPKNVLLTSIQFLEEILKYGKKRAWHSLIHRLNISDTHQCDPLETYMIRCIADLFVQ